MVVACPACESPMREHDLKGVPVDRCDACFGTWFDANELAVAAKRKLPPLEDLKGSERRCPRCRTTMDEGSLGPVRVEHCATCKGTFLDGGELYTLRTGSTSGSATVAKRAAKQPPSTFDWVPEGVISVLELLFYLH